MPKRPCPLCDTQAIFETVHDPNGKRFTCPTCREYFIDPSSEAYVAGLPEVTKTEVRNKLRASANASGPKRLFVIRAPRNDELGGDGRQIARTRMVAEWVSRDE